MILYSIVHHRNRTVMEVKSDCRFEISDINYIFHQSFRLPPLVKNDLIPSRRRRWIVLCCMQVKPELLLIKTGLNLPHPNFLNWHVDYTALLMVKMYKVKKSIYLSQLNWYWWQSKWICQDKCECGTSQQDSSNKLHLCPVRESDKQDYLVKSYNCIENKRSNKSSLISEFGNILREFDIGKSLALL